MKRQNINISGLFLFKQNNILLKTTLCAFIEANSSMISSKSVFSESSLSKLKARSHNLFWFIESRRYERISFSQLAIDSAVVSIICKTFRRLGKTLSSQYSSLYYDMNVRRSSVRDNFKLHDAILAICNLKSPRIIACRLRLNCTKPIFLTHTEILVFNSKDRNKGLGHRTKSLIWTEKASSKQDWQNSSFMS